MPGEGAPVSSAAAAPDLMALVRRMYEDSIIPVREIARRAGVTERTLYKYARKGNWKPRYAWTPSGARPHGQAAPRRWSEARERAAAYAPVKGAGGRFIRREDEGRPFARGIKATAPAARAAAAQASAAAERVARRARAEAEAEAQLQKFLRVTDNVTLAFAEYNRFQRDRAKRGAGEYDDDLMLLHAHLIETAMRRWEWFIDSEDLGINAVERPFERAPVTSACPPPS